MTDNRTAELPRMQLHRLLEKHDVDYWCVQQTTFWNSESGSEFLAYQYQVDGVYKLAFKGVNVTPEQAIAATLGNSKSTADAIAELRKVVREAFSGESVSILVEGHAIMRAIDAVEAATLGSDRDEIYNAGFRNGVQAVFQQLEGIESYEELQDLIAEYWGEGEGNDER